ncbi:GNAT family N-acetyltransferase [Micromonospora echinofusca]|uniref:GNAT family N-acetyltransferase n=1 Tax=Micromonospora echinofusca TaxID=47858 RepID=A0ABS3W2Q3_MICEH|nr:GNAT family N-acetyltransferase [Micromonospora echinofusca]
MREYLRTDRLVLRRFTGADLEDLVALDGDPEVMRYLTGGRSTPRQRMRDEVLPYLLGYYDRGDDFGYWAAVDRRGGFLGWFHLRPHPGGGPAGAPDRHGIELGYRLRRAVWGNGYATEGCRALLRKGFTELGVDRVYAETMAVNVASRRVMEKAGLRYVRTFHQRWPEAIAGSEFGEMEYAVTRAGWWARQDAGAVCRSEPVEPVACGGDSPTAEGDHQGDPGFGR